MTPVGHLQFVFLFQKLSLTKLLIELVRDGGGVHVPPTPHTHTQHEITLVNYC